MLQWLLAQARKAASDSGRKWDSKLESIITFWAHNPERFPKGNLEDLYHTRPADLSRFIVAYVDRYYRERERTLGLSEVKTVPDPAVDAVLQAFARIPEKDAKGVVAAHRVSMSAENLIGSLLERYVAGYLERQGWVWCCGNTIRAVDFLKETPDGFRLLQVKNRDNSENSSSSAIRTGTTIEKWYRISSLTNKTHWPAFPENGKGEYLTEDGFQSFIRDYGGRTKKTPS